LRLIFDAFTGTKDMAIALAGIICPAHKPIVTVKN